VEAVHDLNTRVPTLKPTLELQCRVTARHDGARTTAEAGGDVKTTRRAVVAIGLAFAALSVNSAPAMAGNNCCTALYQYQGGAATAELYLNTWYDGMRQLGWLDGRFFFFQNNANSTITKVYINQINVWGLSHATGLWVRVANDDANTPVTINVGADGQIGPKATGPYNYCTAAHPSGEYEKYHVEVKYKLYRNTSAGWTDLQDNNSYDFDQFACTG
jgi:hypothetical protein